MTKRRNLGGIIFHRPVTAVPSSVQEMNDYRDYEICVKGALPAYWSDWFEGLSIHSESGFQTMFRGPLPDQAALIGILSRLHALNLVLISVRIVGPDNGARQAV